jgi:nicotinamide-nucleotide amidase
MYAEIINIGDELLIGQVVNTNASWMAEQLNLSGIDVIQITVISDQNEAIKSSIEAACKRADLVILTGGLGPTKDDITKQALCDYFDTQLIFNEEAHQQLKDFFALRKLKLSERNHHQAMLPENCIPLKNIHGTAPGMWFEHQKTIIVSLPGVPFEMKSLVTDQIIPRIKKDFQTKHILKRTILTQGIGESDLADLISDWESNLPGNFKLAFLPQPGMTRLRLSVLSNEDAGLEAEMNSQLNKLHQLIPELIWGYEDDTFE